ncbi:MAG: hypothetical protein AAGC95_13230 [Pseudomonadota bacterium]
MPVQSYDVLILSDDAPSLTAAAYFAKAGLSVAVYSVFGATPAAADETALQPAVPAVVWRHLNLQAAGLALTPVDARVVLQPEAAPLMFFRTGQHGLPSVSPEDASVWPDFVRDVRRIGADLIAMRDAETVKGSGRRGMETSLSVLEAEAPPARLLTAGRFGLKSSVEVLSDYFSSREGRLAAAAPALLEAIAGPYAAGTAFGLLGAYGADAWPALRLGDGPSVREVLARTAVAAGAVIDPEILVKELTFKDKRVRGVVTGQGEEIRAKAVVVNAPEAGRAPIDMIIEMSEDAVFAEASPSTSIYYTVDGFGRAEQAFDDVVYGRVPKTPVAAFASSANRQSAGARQNRMLSVRVQACPLRLKDKNSAARPWTKEDGEALAAQIVDKLSSYAPDIGDKILKADVYPHPAAMQSDAMRLQAADMLRNLADSLDPPGERLFFLRDARLDGGPVGAAAVAARRILRTVFKKGDA